MRFEAGDGVHVAHFGKGIVREARNGGRYLVEIKGKPMVVREAEMSPVEAPKRARRAAAPDAMQAAAGDEGAASTHAAASIDLHGRTAAEAEADLDAFLNDALLAGHAEVRVIHGRSGGRVKAAVHARLKQLTSVRAFRVDPRNAGVTVVSLD
ncbi:MAG TPA: Smr/MutS family protein [Vicinamibacterales bacterium]|nr:Smr/MutS family protein [Vicinamibacterales bacterium]